MKKPQIFVLIFLTLYLASCTASQSAIEILGFETWEEPTAEQIKAHFAELVEEYKASDKTDPSVEEKFQAKKKAYEELRSKKFKVESEDNAESDNTGSNARRNSRRRTQNRRRPDPYDYSHTYTETPRSHFSHSSSFNLDDILNNLDMAFLNLQNEDPFKNVDLSFEISFASFLKWLLANPTILLAALLISAGVINLCTCCCCCCCSWCCCKAKGKGEGKDEDGEGEGDAMGSSGKFAKREVKKKGGRYRN